MPESATARIAAKLEAKRNAAAATVTEETEVVSDPDDEEGAEAAPGTDDEADDLVDSKDEAETPEPKPLTMKERAAALRAAKNGTLKPGRTGLVAPAAPTRPKAKALPPAKAAPTTKSRSVERREAVQKAATPGKKPPSPAQLAAREAFAERSRANAAAKRGELPVEAAAHKPQTEAEVKASQNEKRRKEREAAAEAAKPKRAPAGKAVVVQKPSKAAAKKAQAATKPSKVAVPTARAAAAPKLTVIKGGKAASGETKRSGDTHEKVVALWAKGKSRQEIMAELGLSYPAVFYHTKNSDNGTIGKSGSGTRGRIFVETNLDEDGKKMRKPQRVSRSEAMRRLFRAGKHTIGEVAREFEVIYQIAYTALRNELGDTDE